MPHRVGPVDSQVITIEARDTTGMDNMATDDGRSDEVVCRSRLLDHYEAVAAASQRMLAAARDDRWDEVARLGRALSAIDRRAESRLQRPPGSTTLKTSVACNYCDAFWPPMPRSAAALSPWWAQLEDLYRGRVVATTH
jgi:hypothetical protein